MNKITIDKKLDRIIKDFDQHANEDHHTLLKRVIAIERKQSIIAVATGLIILLAALI